jgi:hypothetical protein
LVGFHSYLCVPAPIHRSLINVGRSDGYAFVINCKVQAWSILDVVVIKNELIPEI